jgi:enoyl-CoA hydratase/carnithine racemase
MPTISRLGHNLSLMHSRASDQWRRSAKRLRSRRGLRIAVPPPTLVVAEHVVDGVFEVRLATGERRNVLGRSTIDRIEELVADPPHGTRVILITGAAPDFCAGYDLLEASRGAAESLIAHEDNFTALRRSPIPIIAALQGNVIGGGLELALSADVRIATPDTKFAIPAAKLGLVYSEAGIRLVISAVGESMARAMFLAGFVLDADAAHAMGLVVDIVGREQLRDQTMALATKMASWSTLASRGNRKIIDVIAGRVADDTSALRLASFEPHGDLATSITDFVARRSGTVATNEVGAGN